MKLRNETLAVFDIIFRYYSYALGFLGSFWYR